MSKYERIRLFYAIALGVFTVAVGVAVICVTADIYYAGKGTGEIYTRAIASKRLQALAIPLICLIAAVAVGAVFPLYEVKAKRNSEDAVKMLQQKMPTGGNGAAFDEAKRNYDTAKLVRWIVWSVALAVVLASSVAVLCYVLKTSHFKGEDVTKEIFAMAKNVLPWTAAAFAVWIAAAVVGGVFAERQLVAVKAMIKHGNGEIAPKTDGKIVSVAKAVAANRITLWAVRGVVLAVAVVFIIVGACNGGAHDVWVKATNLCQECIGLG